MTCGTVVFSMMTMDNKERLVFQKIENKGVKANGYKMFLSLPMLRLLSSKAQGCKDL